MSRARLVRHSRYSPPGGGGGGVPAPRFNSGWNNNFFDYWGGAQNELNIIGGSEVQDATSTTLADSYKTAHGFISSTPAGVFTMFFQTPEDATLTYELTWVDQNGAGTIPSVNQLLNGNSLDVSQISSNKIRFKADNNQASGLNSVVLRLNHAGGGKWADNWKCLPVGVSNGLNASFDAKSSAVTFGPDTQFMRSTHWTNVEFGNAPLVSPGPHFRFPGLQFMQDGDGQLSHNLATSANRNQNEQDLYYRDGMPFERIVRIATAKNVSIWHNQWLRCDGTNANGTWGTSTYHQAIAALAASFSQATGKYFAVEGDNEVWNPAYVTFHIAHNEACAWGKVRPDALPQVKLVYDFDVTLSGTPAASDGTVPNNTDRVLVVGKTDKTLNGSYIVNSGGAWSRAADTLSSYCFWYCNGGRYPNDQDIDATTAATAPYGWKNTTWFLRNTGTITPGSTALTITKFLPIERYIQKSARMFSYFESAFNALNIGPANGSANRLIRTITLQNQGPYTFSDIKDFPDGLGGTCGSHVDLVATNIYPDVVSDSPDGVNTFDKSYTGSVDPVIAATYTAIDNELTRAQTHQTVALAAGKKFGFYECGFNNGFTNHTFRTTLWTDSRQKDLQRYKVQKIDLLFPGAYVNWFALNSPVDTTNDGDNYKTAWGLCWLMGDDPNGSHAYRFKAVSDFKNGFRQPYDLTGALASPADATDGSGVGTLKISVAASTSYSVQSISGGFNPAVLALGTLSGDSIPVTVADHTLLPPAGIYSVVIRDNNGGYVGGYHDSTLPWTISGHAYRYYRLLADSTPSGGNVIFAEMEIAAAVSGADTTTGMTATASSTAGSPTWDAVNAIDDSNGTRWSDDGTGAGSWLRVDYGASSGSWVVAKEFRLRSFVASKAPANLRFQGSDNGSSWTTLVTATGLTWADNELKSFAVP
jgi:hypothetical protein